MTKQITIKLNEKKFKPIIEDLIKIRVPDVFSEDDASKARAKLGLPVHNADWALWIHKFLDLAATHNKK